MSEGVMTIELTDTELKLVRANNAYAIDNCPVDGGIMTEDGRFSTKDYYDRLHGKLKASQVKSTDKSEVNDEELRFLNFHFYGNICVGQLSCSRGTGSDLMSAGTYICPACKQLFETKEQVAAHEKTIQTHNANSEATSGDPTES
jgi:hypothetical protein